MRMKGRGGNMKRQGTAAQQARRLDARASEVEANVAQMVVILLDMRRDYDRLSGYSARTQAETARMERLAAGLDELRSDIARYEAQANDLRRRANELVMGRAA